MEKVEGYLCWSKVATKEKAITDWECQSTIKDKGSRETRGKVKLSKIIIMARESRILNLLAEKHNINSKLFSGDGLQRIYKFMRDSEATRCLWKLWSRI